MGIRIIKLRMSIVTFTFLEHVINMMLTKLKVKLNINSTATELETTKDVLQGIQWPNCFAFSFH